MAREDRTATRKMKDLSHSRRRAALVLTEWQNENPQMIVDSPAKRAYSLAMRLTYYAAMLLASAQVFGSATAAEPLSGLWDASVRIGAIQVPFRFGIAVKGQQATGWFFNGGEKVRSSSGTYDHGRLVLDFDSYAKRLDAQLSKDGGLDGAYATTTVGSNTPPATFHAQRAVAAAPPSGTIPSIAGLWLVPTASNKAGEQAWHLIVRQAGAKTSAAILRVDGDTGVLSGTWRAGTLVLSHFDGARPALVEVAVMDGNTLRLVLHNSNGTDQTLTAYRPADAIAKGLPSAADPSKHTAVRDPKEPFQFSFPDLSGKKVSNTDERFKGKVLVIDISGSWCPNCHDEAPFLQSLYRKYHDRGLEVVALSFEDPEQYVNPVRLRAFVRAYDLQYTVLLAGTIQQLHDKLPQTLNLDAYPTTFFIGRDGTVRGSHAGFAGVATGNFNSELKVAFTTEIERLLAERPTNPTDPALARDPQSARQ
jgi:peroxiredoxin